MNQQRQLLSFGSQGADVRKLQEALQMLQYEIPLSEIEGSVFGTATREAVSRFQEANKLDPSGVLDIRAANMLEKQYESSRPRLIHGRVHYSDGTPIANRVIRLLHRHLEEESTIASSATDDTGAYEFIYKLNQFDEFDAAHLALRVAVFDEVGKELASSNILYHPGLEEVVDLQVPSVAQTESEYKKLRAHLQPFLKDADLTILSQEQINYLTNISGLERSNVETLVASHALARSLDLPPELAFVVRNEGIATSHQELLEKPQIEILAAVDRARQQNRLSNSDAKRLTKFIKADLAEKQVESLLRPPEKDEVPTLGAYMNTVPDKFRLSRKTPRG